MYIIFLNFDKNGNPKNIIGPRFKESSVNPVRDVLSVQPRLRFFLVGDDVIIHREL